ncbi:hypothetical protein C2E21_8457 [Chlorella sorokiniana]|uniref:Uncharacterized protein n=1 Tax=Chlorella sorokiniana TaxID=3076 RepID=A0A2P6TET1_CHLSO|nr:hypothetical protein C2E21_8457 [Chlorella sorokiniana]|eukprot:PRW21143.1 hypothetical protein C2E21_8457 [Chlorella sorokiniana]
MQHTEASAGLLSLAANTSDAEGWLMPVAQVQPTSRQERLSEQASLVMAHLLAQAAPSTANWLCTEESADPLSPFQQQTAAPPAQQQQRRLSSQDSEVQPLPRASLAGQQQPRGMRRPSATAAPQPRPASAIPRPASAFPRPAPKPAAPAASRPGTSSQTANSKPLWRPSGSVQPSPVTPRHSSTGTSTRQSMSGTPPAIRTSATRGSTAASLQAQQRPASAAAKQAPRAEELSPSTKVTQWLFSPAHPSSPSLLGAPQAASTAAAPTSCSQPSSLPTSPFQQTFVSARSADATSVSSYLTAAESPAGGDTTPRRPHRLSSSSSSQPSSSQPASPSALPLAPRPGSASSQLHHAQAAAVSTLAAAQAGARAAAEEVALLSTASPGAWAAAQAVAAASPASDTSLLDAQLAQLERLSRDLSDASSQIAEVFILETLANSRRASSSTATRRLSLHSPGASSPGSSTAGTAGVAGMAGSPARPRSLAGSLCGLPPAA